MLLTMQEEGNTARRPYVSHSFSERKLVISTTLEPVASITRRFDLDYHSFKYHVERYYPELVAQRTALRRMPVKSVRAI